MIHSPDSRIVRVARAGTVASLSLGLSALAHGLSCSALPPLGVLAGATPAVGWFAWRGSVREFTLGWLAAAVMGSQAGLHVLYAISGARTMRMPDGSVMAGGQLDLTPGGWSMLLAHLLTALAVIGWLRAGERLLWRAARSAARALQQVAAAVRRLFSDPSTDHADATAELVLRIAYVPPAPSVRLLGHALSRRGPPALRTLFT